MRRLERRIAALEQVGAESGPTPLLDMLLDVFDHGANWYSELAAAATAPRAALDAAMLFVIKFLEKEGKNDGGRWRRLSSPLDRGIAGLLFMDSDDPNRSVFCLERLRGTVPDEVLAAVYNQHRNYAYDASTSLRVRRLAGVVDGEGRPTPGYVLLDNGCIVDARDAKHGGLARGEAAGAVINRSRNGSSVAAQHCVGSN